MSFFIHVDASFTHIREHMKVGGVVGNKEGEWVMGFTRITYACDSFMSELKAIKLGLQITKSQNIHTIIIYSDCMQVINLLCDHEGFPDNYTSVLCECRKL